MPETNKVNEELEENENAGSKMIYIQIADRWKIGHDGTQWLLAEGAKDPKDKNKRSYKNCYPSTLRYALELVSEADLTELFDSYYTLKEISEKFDELVSRPYEDKKDAIDKWFDSIVLTDDIEKKYNSKCKELVKLRNEFKQFKIDHGYEGEE